MRPQILGGSEEITTLAGGGQDFGRLGTDYAGTSLSLAPQPVDVYKPDLTL